MFALTMILAVGGESALAGVCSDVFSANRIRFSTSFEGRTMVYDHVRAAPGKSTALLFVGMYTPLAGFAPFLKHFREAATGEGLLILAYSSQIESLLRASYSQTERSDFLKKLTLDDFVSEATAVLNAEGVEAPITVMGYSFGVAPAARFAEFHRERTSNLVLVAPLVVPGDHSHNTFAMHQAAIAWASLMGSYGRSALTDLRAKAAGETAVGNLDKFLPQTPLPNGVSRESIVQGLVALIRTADDFDLRNEPVKKWPSTYFILGEKEDQPRGGLQREVVARVKRLQGAFDPPAVMKGSAHTVLQDVPDLAAHEILRIMRDESNKAN